jgi:hypothetical protein
VVPYRAAATCAPGSFVAARRWLRLTLGSAHAALQEKRRLFMMFLTDVVIKFCS